MTQRKATTFILAFAIIFASISSGAAGRQVFIAPGDAASLAATVSDRANAGVTVVLAPGVYVLDRELELQPNMQLIGANQYQDVDGDGVWDARDGAGSVFADPASETILDASAVISEMMQLFACGEAAPRVSRLFAPLLQMTGGNVVRSLTVRGARGPAIAPTIDASDVQSDGVDFQVSDAVLVDNSIGVGAIHNDCTFGGAHSIATIERSVFLNNSAAGILFTNALASGARWRGVVRNNRSSGPGLGMALNGGGAACDDAEISVESTGNVFERNNLGVLVQGGREFSGALPGLFVGGSRNRVEWTSHGDAIWNNRQGGGILANGSISGNPNALPSDDNGVRLTLIETRFIQPATPPADANSAGGQRRDVTLSGGNGGTGNEIRILLRRVSSDGEVGSFVITETAGNVVSVIGSEVAFVRANDDVASLPQEP